jgi:hypothetical protein
LHGSNATFFLLRDLRGFVAFVLIFVASVAKTPHTCLQVTYLTALAYLTPRSDRRNRPSISSNLIGNLDASCTLCVTTIRVDCCR